MKSDAITDLKAGFADSDSAIRYWSAMGILMRGKAGVEAARQELTKAARDSSTDVQVAANWALAKHGNDYDRPAALTKLVNLANWSQHNVFTSMSALNAIGDLGDKAKPIAEQLKTLPAKGESPDGRFSGYVARLLADLNGGKPAFEDAGEPQPKKKKKGKK
jgi:HEAT repeat protein